MASRAYPFAIAVLGAVALTAAACGGSHVRPPAGEEGTTIPMRTPEPSKAVRPITTASGAPKVVQFAAPKQFWCLKAHPGQAQATIGWSVPSATAVAVALDGSRLHQGIRQEAPFWVPAGKPDGIGGTVVFSCKSGNRHRLTIRWRRSGAPATTRTVTFHKAAGA